MSFICSIRLKTAIHQLMLSFDTVFVCKIGVNNQYVSRAMCDYEHVFQERLRCAVIGACALIRTNMVVNIFNRTSGFQQSIMSRINVESTAEHQRP